MPHPSSHLACNNHVSVLLSTTPPKVVTAACFDLAKCEPKNSADEYKAILFVSKGEEALDTEFEV